MIKSLLGEDENTKKNEKETPEIKGEKNNSAENILTIPENIPTQKDVKTENTVVETPDNEIETIDEIKTAIATGHSTPKEKNEPPQAVQPFEVSKPIGQPIIEREPIKKEVLDESAKGTISPDKPAKQAISQDNLSDEIIAQENANSSRALELEKKLREIEEELKKEKELEAQRLKKEVEKKVNAEEQKLQREVEPFAGLKTEVNESIENQLIAWDNDDWSKSTNTEKQNDEDSIKIKPKDFTPLSKAEGVRSSGMAWSAAIAFFGSVVFMLVLGWGADTLLGSEPWGIVVGIVFGALIGFIQLIRTTSQIFKPNKPNDFDKVSLKSNFETGKDKKVEEIAEKVEEKREEKSVEKIEEKPLEVVQNEAVVNDEVISEEAETVVKTDS